MMKKILALILALVMALALVACGGNSNNNTTPPANTNTENQDNNENTEPVKEDKTLQVGYSPFNSKFSPFFSETAYDTDAYRMTQLGLVDADRTGSPVLQGIARPVHPRLLSGHFLQVDHEDGVFHRHIDMPLLIHIQEPVHLLHKDIKSGFKTVCI